MRQGLTDLAGLVGTPGFSRATVERRASELAAEEDDLLAALAARAQSDARAAMLIDAREGLFRGGRASFTDAAKAKQALRERFDLLPLEQRRTLIRSTVRVEVSPGRSPDRISIVHMAVPSLNEPGDGVGA
ncbi:hypothetical protein [Janibacter melonis]|uniref:hypothetical protein n=1 Tax=Janibacter melonis TaxID=262209 RepID=UPI001919E748|nr:hypothetical protein [Janibacter melonis]